MAATHAQFVRTRPGFGLILDFRDSYNLDLFNFRSISITTYFLTLIDLVRNVILMNVTNYIPANAYIFFFNQDNVTNTETSFNQKTPLSSTTKKPWLESVKNNQTNISHRKTSMIFQNQTFISEEKEAELDMYHSWNPH